MDFFERIAFIIIVSAGIFCGSAILFAQSGAVVYQHHYSLRADNGTETAATFLSGVAAIDTDNSSTPVAVGANFRIRFQLANEGTANDSDTVYTIQYAPLGGAPNCLSVPGGNFTAVPVTPTFEPVEMTATSFYVNQDNSTNCISNASCNLLPDEEPTFRAASLVEDPSNTSAITGGLRVDRFTEMEFTMAFTGNAVNLATYCFRLSPVDTYIRIAGVKASKPPMNLDQAAYRIRNDDGGETAFGEQISGQIRPDGDAQVSWAIALPGPKHFEAIDDVALQPALPVTADYISDDNSRVDTFDMGTLVSGGIYNRVDVWVYARAVDNDLLQADVIIDGSSLGPKGIFLTNTFAWYSSSFTGLTINQAQLDGLRVRLIQNKVGQPGHVIVAAMYADVYKPVPPATFKAPQNVPVVNQRKGENVRVRFLIKNSGSPSGAVNYRLRYSPLVGPACDGGDEVWSSVPILGSCGSSAVCMASSLYAADQSATANISPGIEPDPPGTFVAGKFVSAVSNAASNISLNANQFTELEYNFQFTGSAANNTSYCFRVVIDGGPLQTYSQIALITTKIVYAASGTYVSNDFDAGLLTRSFNIIEWDWIKTNPACGACEIQFQIKTAPTQSGLDDPGLTWAGPDGKELAVPDETDFFTVSAGERIHTSHNGDRWIRYKAVFSGTEDDRPILSEARINYQQ